MGFFHEKARRMAGLLIFCVLVDSENYCEGKEHNRGNKDCVNNQNHVQTNRDLRFRVLKIVSLLTLFIFFHMIVGNYRFAFHHIVFLFKNTTESHFV